MSVWRPEYIRWTMEVKAENLEIEEEIDEQNPEFSFTRQFQAEEIMVILETYIANINVFKNQSTQTASGKPMTRKIMIQQIADKCSALGNGTRTPKQIEQKLRDEFKKLRRFKNELSGENRKQVGNLLVHPKPSQGTLFLYNSLCDPSERVEVDTSLNIEKVGPHSIELDESTVTDQILQSILDAAIMSNGLSREQSVISPTPSLSREKSVQPPSRKRAHPYPSKPEFEPCTTTVVTMAQRQRETEELKQEYYRELIRNERLVGELLQIRIEKERSGINTTPDPCLETENELGVTRRKI